MQREHILARLFRALSGKTQDKIAERLGVDPPLVSQIELGKVHPGKHLELMAEDAELTVADGEELLELAATQRRLRKWCGPGPSDLLSELADRLRSQLERSFQHLLTLPRQEGAPQPEDRLRAAAEWPKIKEFSEAALLAVIHVEERLRTWALCELLCDASVREASRDLERAEILARVAQAVAELVRGPEGWQRRLKGYAAAHWANVLRVQGDLKAADAAFEAAKRLWQAGSDPGGVLDPGRLLNLEGALRRDQRRFKEALDRLDEAAAVSHSPELALIQKGFTLEVMGEYERAIETLLRAVPLADRNGDPRLKNIARLNLAILLVDVNRYHEAVKLIAEARPLAAAHGDKIDLVRIGWVEGRIAAGLGCNSEALRHLRAARLGFTEHKKSYDVVLTLLEESALLLGEGRNAEVKALTPELAQVFESKGVHREALAALRLFQEAAEREEATAELARNILRYLFRARYDQDLPFKNS